ncbi:ATP-binding protein [Archangium lansingense]|uniref:histidine kinase n=1 Tax=Archangium lansingense TaxID=2995310 RepID=A0ABT4ABT2_9BACT|nr:ATP-binding protein [Archangium lansinium]MCY1078369.1 ATP-binding protein [Archangium lansinium]
MEWSRHPGKVGKGDPANELHASHLLLQALTEVQTEFIQGHEMPRIFDKLLSVLLKLTDSEYGFIGEVQRTAEGEPLLRTHALTNIAWTGELREFYAREAPKGLEFTNLKTLFGAVMTSGQPVVSNAPAVDPRRGGLPEGHPPLCSFLGLPFHSANEMVGMVGIANRPGGYDDAVIAFLQPFLATCCAILQGVRSERRRRQAEEAQRRMSESFRTLIERTPDAIFIHREGTVVFANSSAASLLGHACGTVLRGRPIAELVQPGGEVALTEPSSISAPHEVMFQHHEGRRVLCEVVTLSLLFDGQPATVSITRNITERRLVQEKLLASERLASLGTLAAGVAHEINNPLSYMLSNLQFVDDELSAMTSSGEGLAGERGQEIRDALKEALSGSQRVVDIVRDLKIYSRSSDERRGPVDVQAVIDLCGNMAWSEIRHRARLVKDYGGVPSVHANESRLGQLFLNLLINAAQAIPHGDIQGNEVHVSTRYEEGQVVVAVRDTGEGIPPENLEKLFNAFFTTKPKGVGTGLGLSICHGIITELGGRIAVQSEPGKGTTFQVFLPVGEPPSAAP